MTLFIHKIVRHQLGSSPYDQFLQDLTNSQINVAKFSHDFNYEQLTEQTTGKQSPTTSSEFKATKSSPIAKSKYTTEPVKTPEHSTIATNPNKLLKRPIFDPLKNIFKKGKWIEWEQHGFDRYVTINGTSFTISNPLDEDYPTDDWPPFKIWPQQNFTGHWAASDEKGEYSGTTLHRFTKQELANCFSHGLNRVAVVGDSRGRQFTRAVKLYLQGAEGPWLDKVRHAGFNDNVDNVAELKFYWSSSFIPKYSAFKYLNMCVSTPIFFNRKY